MADFDAELGEVRRSVDALRREIAALGNSEESDAELIAGLHRCDAPVPELQRLARRLRPLVRAQILRGAIWRDELASSGQELGFVPVRPIELAVEVCAYQQDQEPPPKLIEVLDWEPSFDLEANLKMCRSRRFAEIMWWSNVERLLVQAAIGTPDGLELRRVLDEAADNRIDPEGSDLLATDREMALVEPLGRWGHYPVISDVDFFPFTSDKWS